MSDMLGEGMPALRTSLLDRCASCLPLHLTCPAAGGIPHVCQAGPGRTPAAYLS